MFPLILEEVGDAEKESIAGNKNDELTEMLRPDVAVNVSISQGQVPISILRETLHMGLM